MGARPLGRVIDQEIKRPLSDEILFGKLPDGGRVTIGLDCSSGSSADASSQADVDGKPSKKLTFIITPLPKDELLLDDGGSGKRPQLPPSAPSLGSSPDGSSRGKPADDPDLN